MPHPSYDHHALDGEESDDDDQHSISLDDKEPLNQENPPPARSYSKIRLCLAIVVILSFALILISFLNHVLSQSKDSPEVSHHQSLEDCGLSPTSARQSNCVFDPVLMGWVPIRCHDADLASEFLSRKELGVFYRDEDHNSTMLLEEVMAGEWEYVYVSWEFQVLHCMYSWKKTLRAAMNGQEMVLDGYVGDSHHTNHCEMWMMQQGREGIKELGVYMKYVGCPMGSEGKSLGRFGWYRVLGGKRVYRNE